VSNYYYLVSSLPFLYYDKPASISIVYFLDLSERLLFLKDFALLKRSLLFNFKESVPLLAVYGSYRIWETNLRNELVLLRAARMGKEAAAYLKEETELTGLKALARRAFEEASPLQAEELMNRARWEYLTELEAGHFFNIQYLAVYYLKLQLLKYRTLFNEEKGKEAFSVLHQQVFERLKAGVEVYGK
jgi:hypothetical protein